MPLLHAWHLSILLVVFILLLTHVYHLSTDVLSPDLRHATIWQDPLLWHDLPLTLYQSLDMTGCLSNINLLSCYHLTPSMIHLTLMIITITGMMTWHLDSTTVLLLHMWYFIVRTSTPDIHVFLIFLTCSCSFPKSDNYLINHKRNNLYRVGGNLRLSICVRVYSGF